MNPSPTTQPAPLAPSTAPAAPRAEHAGANRSAAARWAILAYGVGSYALGVGALVWLILTSLGVVPFAPFQDGSEPDLGTALGLNLAGIALFGLQHAVMARPAFKRRWTRWVAPAIERSTFVLTTGLLLGGILATWRPIAGAPLWSVESESVALGLRALAALGWGYMLLASFAVNHFHLFGLQQVWRAFRGVELSEPKFVRRLLYRFDRHPIMTGMLIGLWSTPTMSPTHFALAAGFTLYIVIGVAIEERTLVALHGDDYRAYRREVRALVPTMPQ